MHSGYDFAMPFSQCSFVDVFFPVDSGTPEIDFSLQNARNFEKRIKKMSKD